MHTLPNLPKQICQGSDSKHRDSDYAPTHNFSICLSEEKLAWERLCMKRQRWRWSGRCVNDPEWWTGTRVTRVRGTSALCFRSVWAAGVTEAQAASDLSPRVLPPLHALAPNLVWCCLLCQPPEGRSYSDKDNSRCGIHTSQPTRESGWGRASLGSSPFIAMLRLPGDFSELWFNLALVCM